MGRNKKTVSEKQVFWQNHIDAWRKSGQSQADYCGLNHLPVATFSKWKKKLHPDLKGRLKTYTPINDYAKNTKLSNAEYEALIDCFFAGDSLKRTQENTKISTKTVARVFDDLTTETINGSLHYPHLFYGVGPLLLLCPPPDVTEHMLRYQANFPNRIYRYRDEATEKGRLRNNIEFIFRLLIAYSSYEWSIAETFVFREMGLKLYYVFNYSKEHNTEPQPWSLELYSQMARDINLVAALKANMDHWAIERNMTSFFEGEYWERIFTDRKRRSYDKKWIETMAKDLKWVLKHRRIGDVEKQRNTYWDEFAPSEKDIKEARKIWF